MRLKIERWHARQIHIGRCKLLIKRSFLPANARAKVAITNLRGFGRDVMSYQ